MGLLLKNLSKTINITFKQRKKAISLSKKLKKFEMIKIVEDLNWTELEKVEANMIDFSGVHFVQFIVDIIFLSFLTITYLLFFNMRIRAL